MQLLHTSQEASGKSQKTSVVTKIRLCSLKGIIVLWDWNEYVKELEKSKSNFLFQGLSVVSLLEGLLRVPAL